MTSFAVCSQSKEVSKILTNYEIEKLLTRKAFFYNQLMKNLKLN